MIIQTEKARARAPKKTRSEHAAICDVHASRLRAVSACVTGTGDVQLMHGSIGAEIRARGDEVI